jgi:hypothetical protein
MIKSHFGQEWHNSRTYQGFFMSCCCGPGFALPGAILERPRNPESGQIARAISRIVSPLYAYPGEYAMILKSRQSVLNQAFSSEQQQAMRDEDSEAWGAVTSILFVIVTGGAILGIIGVLLAM